MSHNAIPKGLEHLQQPGETAFEHAQRLLEEQKRKRHSVEGYKKRKAETLVSTKAYKKAIDGLETERILDKESVTRRIGKSIGDIKMPVKIAGIVGAGAAIGSLHTLTDDTDDNLLSTGLKIGGYTAAIGGTYAAVSGYHRKDEAERQKRTRHWEYVKEQYERQTEKMDADYRAKHKQLVEDGMTPDQATEKLSRKGMPNRNSREKALEKVGGPKVDREMVMEERAVRTAKGVMRIGKIGVGITALGGVVSAAHSVKESHDARQMVAEQNDKQMRRKRQEKEERQRYGYGNVNLGNIVFDMFEERNGHHKMGNSKF